jgi:eukaryotic-like serine/threonine-protein kinase
MGIVVAARHLELEERVAIKFLLRKDEPSAVERFMREARAAAKVKNEHVCRVYDVGRLESGEPYLVMEYLDGLDLADKLRASTSSWSTSMGSTSRTSSAPRRPSASPTSPAG